MSPLPLLLKLDVLPQLLNSPRSTSRAGWWRGAILAYLLFQVSMILAGQWIRVLDVRTETLGQILNAVSWGVLALAVAIYLIVCVQRLRTLGLSPWIAAAIIMPPIGVIAHIVICGVLDGRWTRGRQAPLVGAYDEDRSGDAMPASDLAALRRNASGALTFDLDRAGTGKLLGETVIPSISVNKAPPAQHSSTPSPPSRPDAPLPGNRPGDPNRPRLPGDRLTGRR